MADPAALAELARLLDVMHRLRAPGGCPWDREQTFESLRPYVVEEAYEVVDAIDLGDPSAHCEELGDLLLQVVFQAEIGGETGRFRMADVARAIADKLERRHPHVFGDLSVEDADEVVRNWKRIKAEERAAKLGEAPRMLHGVPRALPALPRAQQVGSRIAHAGFDWPDAHAVLVKLDEERRELGEALAAGDRVAAARELGDLLLTATSLARHLGVEAEMALRDATTRLESRVRHVESAARADGIDLASRSPAELDRLWEAAKAALV